MSFIILIINKDGSDYINLILIIISILSAPVKSKGKSNYKKSNSQQNKLCLKMQNQLKHWLKRIFIGFKKGYQTPTLPDHILKITNYPIIRIFRFLGGLSFLLILSKNYLNYPIIVLYLAMFIATIYTIYHFIISYFKIKHIIKILRSDELDIRNSPLDRLATLGARALLCFKGACDTTAQPVGLTLGLILGAATMDGYRRQIVNDRKSNILDEIQKQRNSLSEDTKAAYDKIIEESFNNTKNKAAILRYNEAADEYKKAVDKYNANPSEYNNNEIINANKKLTLSFDEINKLDISEYLTSIYNKYGEFLDSLTPDKIVCLFNIIIDALVLSSFLSVLSIMLSENIINKIVFLEKYPRILSLLKLRNNINKKVSKIYLLMHIIIIIFGILGNIYMFFI